MPVYAVHITRVNCQKDVTTIFHLQVLFVFRVHIDCNYVFWGNLWKIGYYKAQLGSLRNFPTVYKIFCSSEVNFQQYWETLIRYPKHFDEFIPLVEKIPVPGVSQFISSAPAQTSQSWLLTIWNIFFTFLFWLLFIFLWLINN